MTYSNTITKVIDKPSCKEKVQIRYVNVVEHQSRKSLSIVECDTGTVQIRVHPLDEEIKKKLVETIVAEKRLLHDIDHDDYYIGVDKKRTAMGMETIS